MKKKQHYKGENVNNSFFSLVQEGKLHILISRSQKNPMLGETLQ